MDLQEQSDTGSILFVAGEPVTIAQLAETLQTKVFGQESGAFVGRGLWERGLRIQYERDGCRW